MIKNAEKLIKYQIKKLGKEQKINIPKTARKVEFTEIKVEISDSKNRRKP